MRRGSSVVGGCRIWRYRNSNRPTVGRAATTDCHNENQTDANTCQHPQYATNILSRRTLLVPRSTFLQHLTRSGRDLIPHIPKLFIEKMLHTLMEDLDRRAHSAHYSASDYSLRQFQMMEAKQVNAFVEIQQAFSHIVQPKEFFVAPVNVVNGYIRLAQVLVESLAQPRPNVQQR
jgi:hypothetical protein